MEGGDDHQRDLHREKDGDDDYQHHGGVVGFPLSLVVSAATGGRNQYKPPDRAIIAFKGTVFYCLLRHNFIKRVGL